MSRDERKLVELKGCAEVERDGDYAKIRLVVGDRSCSTILSDGRGKFVSGPL